MRGTGLRLLVWSLSIAFQPALVSAQSEAAAPGVAPPFHVAFVEGSVTLLRAGEAIALASGEPIVDGDRLQSAAGRLELRGPDGERLFLDQGSTLDVVQAPVFRLFTGAVRAELDGPARPDGAPVVEIDTPHGTAALFDPGSYRVSVLRRPGNDETEVVVRAGRGEVFNPHGRVMVRARQRVTVSAYGSPSFPETLAAGDLVDSFDRWVDQAVGATAPTPSASYLPAELSSYSAALDTAGSWSYEPTYGHVWYPTVVVNWQPYYYGFWRPLGYYGYTWVSHTPWAWATHHYGRWGFGAGGWFWIPGATWGSAWVSWGVGPGYVAWCPLGWGNRPVYPAPFRRYHGDGWRAPYGNYGPRGLARGASSWTVVRAEHFRAGLPASKHAVDWRRLDGAEHGAFVEQRSAPRLQLAVPRGSAVARSRGTDTGQAVPRAAGATPTGGRSRPPAYVAPEGRTPQRGVSNLNARAAQPTPATSAAPPTAGRAVSRYPTSTVRDAAGLSSPRLSVMGRSPQQAAGAEVRRVGPAAGPEPRPLGAGRIVQPGAEVRQRWTPPPTHYGIPPERAAAPMGPSPTSGRSGSEVVGMPASYARAPGGARMTQPTATPRYTPRSVQRDSPRAGAPAQSPGGPAVRSAPQRSPGGGSPAAAGRAQAGTTGPAQGRAVSRGGASPRSPRQ